MAGLTKSPRKQTNKQIPLIKTYGIIYMGYILFRPLHRNVCLLVQFPSFSILFHKLRALYKQVTIKKSGYQLASNGSAGRTHLVPAPGKQKQAVYQEFKASLG